MTLERPVKLRLGPGRHYLAGRSIDQSTRGLLVELSTASSIPIHQPVAVVVARPGRAVVRARELRSARVVRWERTDDGGCRVALSFQAAALRAAG